MIPNGALLVDCLGAIHEGTMTFDYFRGSTGIKGVTVAKEILKFLLERGIGKRSSKTVLSFSSTDRLKASIMAVGLGADIMKISQYLSWKDFEKFASEILLNCGFKTMNNVRFTKPRAEIDIIAIKSELGLSIDCKHWATNSRSGLNVHTRKQIQRTERLLSSPFKFRKIVPLLLTIHPNFQPSYSDLVPVVDINKFRCFVNEVELNVDKVFCISRD
jgi:hypothetical protein